MSLIKKQVLLIVISALVFTGAKAQTEFYVSPTAVKGGNGSIQSPFSTIDQAKAAVRKINKKMKSDITVFLREGSYQLSTPVNFDEYDSGMNGFNIIYKSYKDEVPVINGGVAVGNWKATNHKNIYCADLKTNEKIRALFINGKRARMAITENQISGYGSWGEFEIKGTEPWAYGEGKSVAAVKFHTRDLPFLTNPEDIELIHKNVWNEKILCASKVDKLSNDTILIHFQQPYGSILNTLAWAGKTKFNKGFFVRNAIELLDNPGEFYYDRKKQKIFYYSQGEDMSKAKAVVPVSEGLIRIKGSSTKSGVSNLIFEGLTFSYDKWNLMKIEDSYGFGGIQSLGLAIKYVPSGNWHPTKYNSTDVAPGTIDIRNAKNIKFVLNKFEHINSATAISLVNDVTNSEVNGNFFNDLLGNAISVGHPQHYEIGDGDIFKFGIEGVCKNISVTNNYIRNISIDFRMVEAILAFFVEDVKFEHNDISGTPYGAIACGWWWANAGIPASEVGKNNSISYNKLGKTHLVLHDGGIIYTLGKQPNSVITGNYLFNGPRCIYPDDGSAYFTITNNFINSLHNLWLHIASDRCHDIVIDHNYVKDNGTINNGVNTPLTNTINYRNRPFDETAEKIMQNAGIKSDFKKIIPETEPAEITIYPFVAKEAWIN